MQSSNFRNQFLFKQHFYTELNTQGLKRLLALCLSKLGLKPVQNTEYFFLIILRPLLKQKEK